MKLKNKHCSFCSKKINEFPHLLFLAPFKGFSESYKICGACIDKVFNLFKVTQNNLVK